MSAPAVLGLDVGAAWVKRSRLAGQQAVPVADPAWGALRTPRLAVEWDAAAPVLLTATSEALQATRQELEQQGVEVRGAIDPLVAIALAARQEHPPAEACEHEAVIDLGHRDVRLGWIRWRGFEGRDYPSLEGYEVASPLAGARLDEDLGYALSQPPEAVRELKELFSRTRGPWAWGDVELDAARGRTLIAEFAETWQVVLPTVAALVRERPCGRIVVAGGMARLPEVREPLLEALAPLGLPVVLASSPGFAAARGAAYAAAGAGSPLSPPIHVWVADAGRVSRRELVSAGQVLPAELGPFALERERGGSLLLEFGDEAHALELPPGAQSLTLAWSFDGGWTARVDGSPLPLQPPSDAQREARERAQGFDWSSCGQAVEVDALVVFRATAGGGRCHELVRQGLPALLAPLGRARLRAIAVGDHPQAHLRPRFVTAAQPAWGDAETLQAFVGETLAEPVEGIDIPDAFEVALDQAVGLDWRPGAARVVFVLSDVPAHVPENPPYSPLRWQDAAQRLRDAGAELVGVHVQGGGRPPSVIKSARAFLEELDPGCVGLAGEVPASLTARLAEVAARRRPDPAGQALLDALGGWVIR